MTKVSGKNYKSTDGRGEPGGQTLAGTQCEMSGVYEVYVLLSALRPVA